ncbi:histone deacetylation protein Rxt3-domain-containing protein [Syncephalis plumigaleata]|nr:histone deacetylation protein Rxt3-domain-containing protein [Syncephalis plumigaleata]
MEATLISPSLASTPSLSESVINQDSTNVLASVDKNSQVPSESTTDSTFVVVRNSTTLELALPLNTAIHLGFHRYEPSKLLPPLIGKEQGIVVVRIPSTWLTFTNPAVKQRRIWGTDIYTDDSDVVAALIHTGKYTPLSPHPLLQQDKIRETRRGIMEDKAPNYDLEVTLRVVSRLQRYTGTVRHYIRSRDWTEHDGASFMIHNVKCIQASAEIQLDIFSRERKRGITHMHISIYLLQ